MILLRKEPRGQVKSIFNVYSFHHHRRSKCQAGIPSTQPIADSMPTSRLQRWPNTTLTLWVCFILSGSTTAETCHSPNVGPCNVFDADPTLKQHWVIVSCLLGLRITIGWRFTPPPRIQKSHYPDNTIHWPNVDVMLGHRLWRWANIITALSL